MKEYIIAGVKEVDFKTVTLYKVSEEQLQGMFVVMYRRYFGDSHPKGYPTPEEILKNVEQKETYRVVLSTKEDGKIAFSIKRADKANWPYGYGDIDFGTQQ